MPGVHKSVRKICTSHPLTTCCSPPASLHQSKSELSVQSCRSPCPHSELVIGASGRPSLPPSAS
eukprot:7464816-Heterocapsa_arctica.AAC.1